MTRHVLLHGEPAALAVRAEAFARAGTTPDVPAHCATAVVNDLAQRGVVRIVEDADPWQYDEVVACRPRPRATPHGSAASGRVVLVGGGPGRDDLLTLAGLDALRAADVVVCDRLAPLGVLDHLSHDPEIIHVGKIPRGEYTPQESINALLVERARAGQVVVRFKGGDGFVLGRGSEEYDACVAAGIPVVVVPGVSSAVAVPALAGIPVTERGIAQGFVVVSGHVSPDDPRSDVNWDALAQSRLTLVVLMGVVTLPRIAERLQRSGLASDTPVAIVENGGTQRQRVTRGTLTDIAATASAAGVAPPAVVIIGAVTDRDRDR